ncbi:hypothetical protein RW115_12060 [Macrococcus capreoli]
MEISLSLIQTIAAIISIFITIYALILQYQSSKNEKSMSIYQNNGIHNQNTYHYNTHQQNIIIQKQHAISKQKSSYIKYYHHFFNSMLLVGVIFELYKLYKNNFFADSDFNLFNGMLLTNIFKLAVQCLQSGISSAILINIISALFFMVYIIIKFKTKIRYLIPTFIILLSNIYIFFDLLNTNYSQFIINQFEVFQPTITITNLLLTIFFSIVMFLIVCNNMILAIYIFDLESYKNQFSDFLSRGLIITSTIIIFVTSKWFLLSIDWNNFNIHDLLDKL